MMAEHVLYVATYGPEDRTRATLVFAAAIRMRQGKGLPVKVALLGKGVELLKQAVAKKLKVTGHRPPFKSIYEMMIAALKAGVEIHC
jgi:predicted peroxiredoxin